jgi:hypothetical protein
MVHLKLKKSGDHFSWKKPQTIIHNIVFGTLWAEHVSTCFEGPKSAWLNPRSISYFSKPLIYTHAKISHLVSSLPTSRRYVFACTACQQVWNNLLTVVTTLLQPCCKVVPTSPIHDISILLQPFVVSLVTFLFYHHSCFIIILVISFLLGVNWDASPVPLSDHTFVVFLHVLY